MSSVQANEVIYYNSLYRHGVDEKRRLQIPAKWRPSQGAIELTLILWPKGAHKACLLALPPNEWVSLVSRLKTMPFADQKTAALRRLIGRNSDQIPLDKGGRICLPEAMAKAAAIEKEAVLVGLVDRFEIWNPQRYDEASIEDEALSSEAFQLI